MPLVTLKEVLADADRRHYAVGAFNIINTEMLKAVLGAAEEEQSPVILAYAEGHQQYIARETIAPLLLNAAREAPVPVVVHFDHGQHYENIIQIIHCGFTSVMFDGSTLPYEENVRLTREVVRNAHILGVSVEAELGHVGGAEGGSGGDRDPEACYTDVDQAADFVTQTGVDALAVAIGTAHGVYRRKPRLDLERLAAIKERVGIPLVLHGGSGLGDDDFRQAVARGINKINIFTDLTLVAVGELKRRLYPYVAGENCGSPSPENSSSQNDDSSSQLKKVPQPAPGYVDLLMATTTGIKAEVQRKMRLFGSSGKAL